MTMLELITIAALANGVAPSTLKAICWVESRHNPNIIHKDDGGSDSYGICQIKLATARFMGFKGKAKDLLDPKVNLHYAAKYLKYQKDRYGDNVRKAISAYNAGRYIKANKKYVDKVSSLRVGMFSSNPICGAR